LQSDEELASVERGDLVEAARQCYDEETARRIKPLAEVTLPPVGDPLAVGGESTIDSGDEGRKLNPKRRTIIRFALPAAVALAGIVIYAFYTLTSVVPISSFGINSRYCGSSVNVLGVVDEVYSTAYVLKDDSGSSIWTEVRSSASVPKIDEMYRVRAAVVCNSSSIQLNEIGKFFVKRVPFTVDKDLILKVPNKPKDKL
jgi:hypothetical protein